MTTKLFLDDFRSPSDCAKYMYRHIGSRNPIYLEGGWIIVRNFKEFQKWITKYGLPDLISFDHDLSDEHYLLGTAKYADWTQYYSEGKREMTGYDCAKWLIEYCQSWDKKLPEYIVHSESSGKGNIEKILRDNK